MGLFSSLFSKSSRSDRPADLSALRCDVHSHFIPGIDDGAQTMEDSLALLRSMSELGYSKVVTTPHVMSDAYRNTPEIILGGLEKVRARLKEERIALEIDAAAEYYLDFDFERKIDGGGLLSFGNRFVLFELSFMNPPDNLNNIIFKLITSGYRPVLAHPERYTYWHNKFEQYEALVEKGTLLQLNIASLTGHYSLSTRKIAEQLIEKDMISLLGSDCHHPGHISLIREARYEKALHTVLERGKLLNSSL